MFDFHQKRKMKTVFGSRFTQSILIIVSFFVIMSAGNRYMIAREMAERRSAAELEIQALQDRRETLEAEVQYLSNERGVEAEMRRQFDIAREGEQVVIIIEDENESGQNEAIEATSTPSRAWYRFW
jgi:cell division protein FtsB